MDAKAKAVLQQVYDEWKQHPTQIKRIELGRAIQRSGGTIVGSAIIRWAKENLS